MPCFGKIPFRTLVSRKIAIELRATESISSVLNNRNRLITILQYFRFEAYLYFRSLYNETPIMYADLRSGEIKSFVRQIFLHYATVGKKNT